MQLLNQGATEFMPLSLMAINTQAGDDRHCQRVAFWAEQLAAEQNLRLDERRVLREAALAHHGSPFSDSAIETMLGEFAGRVKEKLLPRTATPSAEQVLAHFRGTAEDSSPRVAELAHILALANRFDEQIEYSSYSEQDLDTLVADADTCEVLPISLLGLLKRLRKCGKDDLRESMSRLPVYPVVVLKLTKLLANDDVGIREVERVAQEDQVISGRLVQIANSALYSPATPIRTLSQAIAYVGLDNAKRAFLACGIQRLYAHPRLYAIWQHSIEAAHTAERIAALAGKGEPGEAFLLGLLHDVGALAIGLLREEVYLGIQQLRSNGCDMAVAEKLVCGFDHAKAGAEILKHWKFADDLAHAVQYHHCPEETKSPLASILYLTEFWTNSEEDLPSTARLAAALENTGLTLAQLEEENPRPEGIIAALK